MCRFILLMNLIFPGLNSSSSCWHNSDRLETTWTSKNVTFLNGALQILARYACLDVKTLLLKRLMQIKLLFWNRQPLNVVVFNYMQCVLKLHQNIFLDRSTSQKLSILISVWEHNIALVKSYCCVVIILQIVYITRMELFWLLPRSHTDHRWAIAICRHMHWELCSLSTKLTAFISRRGQSATVAGSWFT